MDILTHLYFIYISVTVEKILESCIIVLCIVTLVGVTALVFVSQNKKYYKEHGRTIPWATPLFVVGTCTYAAIVVIVLLEIWV